MALTPTKTTGRPILNMLAEYYERKSIVERDNAGIALARQTEPLPTPR